RGVRRDAAVPVLLLVRRPAPDRERAPRPAGGVRGVRLAGRGAGPAGRGHVPVGGAGLVVAGGFAGGGPAAALRRPAGGAAGLAGAARLRAPLGPAAARRGGAGIGARRAAGVL